MSWVPFSLSAPRIWMLQLKSAGKRMPDATPSTDLLPGVNDGLGSWLPLGDL